MPKQADDWEKPRTRGQKLTVDEVEKIKIAFVLRRPIRSIAKELKCASRNVTKYYGYFRAEGVEQITKQTREHLTTDIRK